MDQFGQKEETLPAYHSSDGGLQGWQGRAGSGGGKLSGSQRACLSPPPPPKICVSNQNPKYLRICVPN